jgi:hypothetical protein
VRPAALVSIPTTLLQQAPFAHERAIRTGLPAGLLIDAHF